LYRLARFIRENGLYLLSARLHAVACGSFRNAFLARKFGVKKIRIGARAILYGLSFIHMGEDFSAMEGLWLEAISAYQGQHFSPAIKIGKHVRVSRFVHIAATHRVEIGDHVLMGSNVLVTDHNHGRYAGEHTSPQMPPALRPLDHDRTVQIANNVWLGEAVVVMPGASIGEGSIIAAHSVVLGHIPAFCIAAGTPATVRKIFNFETSQWESIARP
jgi:lipopolysaccharide O-acetyltransferase